MADPSTWSLADILDLAFFLEEDQDKILAGQEEELHRRDREIYQRIKARCQDSDASRQASCLLRQWLEQRRRNQGDAGCGCPAREPGLPERNDVLPGQLFTELIRIASWLFFVLALLTGWGLTISFLSYSGTSPINVATFLAIFVCSQLLFLVLLLFFLAAGRLQTRPPLPLTYSLVRRGLLALLRKIGRRVANTKSSRWLERLSGNVHAHGELYGPLFIAPVFLLVQLGAMGFNLGILAALLFKVMTTDLAFGWQTTLQTGAAAVARLVELIALPWSWLFPAGIGYPDLTQIQGSHIVLKEGIRHLSSTDLTSWWPFLVLCVTVYGFFPRLLLYVGGRIATNRLLKSFRFDSAGHQQLLQRMRTPLLTTTEQEPLAQPGPERQARHREPAQANQARPGRTMLLVPEELAEEYPLDTLTDLVRRQSGAGELEILVFDLYDAPHPLVDRQASKPVAAVLILQEAWQPPINEFFYFLKRLRQELDTNPHPACRANKGDESRRQQAGTAPESHQKICVSVLLVGRPEQDAELTPPRQRDRAIWMEKISALGDPYLNVLSYRRP